MPMAMLYGLMGVLWLLVLGLLLLWCRTMVDEPSPGEPTVLDTQMDADPHLVARCVELRELSAKVKAASRG